MNFIINKSLQALLIVGMLIFLAHKSEAQTLPDPFVNSATVTAAPTFYGASNSITFQFLNVSPVGTLTFSPTTTVTLQLSKMDVVGTFTPLSVTGSGALFFTWTYDSTLKIITGTIKTSVPPFSGGVINIANLIVTDSATITSPQIGFSVTVNAASSNNASTTNDFTSSYTYTQSSPLPVEWLGFNVKRYGKCAHLKWTTTSEVNVSHYTPQFSLNGVDFTDLGNVNPQNGTSTNEYLHLHNIEKYILTAKDNPVLYYRVKQYDLNKQFTLTSVKKINLNALSETGFTVHCFPNPASDYISVSVDGISLDDAVYYKLLDMQGRVVFEQKNVTHIETDNIEFPLKSLARGAYMLKVNNGEYEYFNRILVK